MSIDFLFPKMAELAEKMRWEAREVVRDTAEGPQLFERITLSGPIFEERAQEPFVRIGKAAAQSVEIAEDGTQVRAYFDRVIPDNQPIEFGYLGDDVLYRFPNNYRSDLTPRLDHKRLPKGIRLLKPHPDRSRKRR